MYNSPLFIPQSRRMIPAATRSIAAFLAMLALIFGGCKRNSIPDSAVERNVSTQVQPPGAEFLIGFLDELDAIAGAGGGQGNISSSHTVSELFNGTSESSKTSRDARNAVLFSAIADTTFVYGEITPEGLGAVVTERHQYPKGLLLITVRKTHGKPLGGIVTETRKYISFTDLRRDSAQQSNITDITALSGDTIVTHVLRNGILETYTFRLPVVTRVVNPRDGSVRVTSRFGSYGAVVSEVRDGNGALIQLRRNIGLADGSVVSYTQFADSTWRNVRTIGQADGTVFHEITSGP